MKPMLFSFMHERSLLPGNTPFFMIIGCIFLTLGCGTAMELKEGDEEMSYLQGEDRVRLEFDYSQVTFGEDPDHYFEKEVFFKTREKEWQEKWKACKDSLYPPKFLELYHKYHGVAPEFDPEMSTEESDYVAVVEIGNIEMKDMSGLMEKSFMGTSGADRYVIIDYRVAFYPSDDRSSPLTVLEKKRLKGASMSFDKTFPEGNAIKNSLAVLGKNLGKHLDKVL